MIRKFTLKNSLGKTWSLNDNSSFFHDIKGLGIERKVTYVQLDTKFTKEKDLLSQKNIQGKIRFESYNKYRDFTLFAQHKPLVLIYETSPNNVFYINVSIDKLEKKELETGFLFCNISMKSTGTYYRLVVAENMKEQKVTGKSYSYRYPYTYYDFANGEVEIESDSVLKSTTKISIYGPCKNPSYNHIVNGIVKASGKINANIPEGNKLVIDSTSIPYSIKEYTLNNEFAGDLYEKSDFSTERFIFLEYGKNKITFTHESSDMIMVSVDGEIEYESV